VSLEPASAELRAIAADECNGFDGDPRWPAFARHVARTSTPEDRALLIDLAAHPGKRSAPLSWGLQYYVRGDLVLADDSIITLDELCAEGGMSPLPLLEDMPDEMDIQPAMTPDEPTGATDVR
jgi:hypothetical protein